MVTTAHELLVAFVVGAFVVILVNVFVNTSDQYEHGRASGPTTVVVVGEGVRGRVNTTKRNRAHGSPLDGSATIRSSFRVPTFVSTISSASRAKAGAHRRDCSPTTVRASVTLQPGCAATY